jgi:alpha-L-rhamnosidase
MLLNRKEYPSWLYPVTQGATTIWERWDTQKPDGTIIDGMNSFNHYAYGAIGEWLYTHVAGLKIDAENPGYQHIILAPHPGGGLTQATATHQSMFGEVKSSWEIKDGIFNYNIAVPANTTATVTLPNAKISDVKMNNQNISTSLGNTSNKVEIKVGSGNYQFTYPMEVKN